MQPTEVPEQSGQRMAERQSLPIYRHSSTQLKNSSDLVATANNLPPPQLHPLTIGRAHVWTPVTC